MLMVRTRNTEKNGRTFQRIPHVVQNILLEKTTGFLDLRKPSATGNEVDKIEMSVQIMVR